MEIDQLGRLRDILEARAAHRHIRQEHSHLSFTVVLTFITLELGLLLIDCPLNVGRTITTSPNTEQIQRA
jgi:hypothetical protein